MSLFEWLPAFAGFAFFAGAMGAVIHAERRYRAADDRLIKALMQERRNDIADAMKEVNE
ncbi:MAG: hypothetical protein WC121_11990 [Candidatus Kapaibacterium sp.]|jgi:hypothetical protein